MATVAHCAPFAAGERSVSQRRWYGTLAVIASLLWAGAAPSGAAAQSPATADPPLTQDQSSPGPDRPDVMVYRSAAGFSVSVPAGWMRRDVRDGVRFADNDDRVEIGVSDAAKAPTTADARSEVARLARTRLALRVLQVKDVELPAGPAMTIEYFCRRAPDPEARVHLRNRRYLFFKAGKLVSLDFSAPEDADTADRWQRIARSFRWE